MGNTAEALKNLLAAANAEKTGERSEQQRRLAILATKIEEAYAWAKHTYEEV